MEKLAWHVQIHSLCASLSKIYYIIKALRNATSTMMIWSSYFVYIVSQEQGMELCFGMKRGNL